MNQFDGILLKKTIVKEQDLIVTVLTENGVKLNLYVYGGMSSKKRQSSILEYGHVLSFKLKTQKKETDLKTLEEHKLKWSGNQIRENYNAFYLMSFYLEIISSIGTETDDMEHAEHKEFYNLLANSLFYLNEHCKNLNSNNHLFLFLTKILFYLGIMPDLNNCIVSGNELSEFPNIELDMQNGGFIGNFSTSKVDNQLLIFLKKAFYTKFKDIDELSEISKNDCHKLFNYMCSNIGIDKKDFKLYPTLLGKS